jgi:predicted nucleic-acid-binding protein
VDAVVNVEEDDVAQRRYLSRETGSSSSGPATTARRRSTRPCSRRRPSGERWRISRKGYGGTCGAAVRAVDTNFLVRLVTRDDPEQTTATEAFVSGGAWISHIVLVEAMWVLDSAYDLGPERIATAVEMLLNHRDLTIQEPNTVTAALRHFQRRPNLGFSDCLILEVARKAGHLPLGTFDRDLGKLEGTRRL